MDPKMSDKAINYELSELDLKDLDPGQVVQLVTNRGDFWIIATTASSVHVQAEPAAQGFALISPFAERAPLETHITRDLKKGGSFQFRVDGTMISGAEATDETIIDHILMTSEKAKK